MSLHRASLWTGSRRRRQLALMLIDAALLLLTAVAAVALRRWLIEGVPAARVRLWPLPGGIGLLVFAYLVALYVFDQYNLKRDISRRGAAMVLGLACVVGVGLTSSLTFFLRNLELGRFVALFHLPLAYGVLYVWRWLFFARLLQVSQPHRVLLVASNPVERGIEAELRERPLGDYSVMGVFSVAGGGQEDGRSIQDKMGRTLEQVVADERIDTLVFSARDGLPPQYLEQAIDWKFDGVGVYDAANFYGAMTGRVPIETIDARWVLDHLSQPYGSAFVRRLKRLLDIGLALAGLAISLPFWPLLVVLIRLDSPGPAIFRQERLGLRQKPDLDRQVSDDVRPR